MGSTLPAGLVMLAAGTGNFGLSPPVVASVHASVLPSENVWVVGSARVSASGSGPA